MRFLILILLLFLFNAVTSQVVKGYVKDEKKNAIAGVNVFIKGTYNGTSTNVNGYFVLKINNDLLSNKQLTIIFSMLGFCQKEMIVTPKDSVILEIFLKEKIQEINAVTITAGTYEAGDKRRNTTLNSTDILTTGASNADITSAIKMLPGVQKVGEKEGLFVRGGTNDETKYYIDGMIVDQPFYTGAPNIAQRGRFSPNLFNGYAFCNGGYSAIYGDALTSVLSLESIDIPEKSSASIGIGSVLVNAGIQELNKSKTSSWGLDLSRTDLNIYYSIIKQKYDYVSPPYYNGYTFNYRKKYKNGIFKILHSGNNNKVGLLKNDIDSINLKDKIKYYGTDFFTIITNKLYLNNNNILNCGIGYSSLVDNINISLLNSNNSNYLGNDPLFLSKIIDMKRNLNLIQGKIDYEYNYKNLGKLKIGGQFVDFVNKFTYGIFNKNINDSYSSIFIENDYNLNNNIAFKVGMRTEYSDILKKYNIAPKLAIAYKISQGFDFNIAYGQYYQRPDLLQFALYKIDEKKWSNAQHLISGINYKKNNRILRIEYFHYKYINLTEFINPSEINFKGNGFSNGVDVFYRDKKTIKNFDYWISYSFLNAKRKYLNYPNLITPDYCTPHSFNFVVKRFFEKPGIELNLTYSFSTARPYYNIKYIYNEYKILDKGNSSNINDIGLSVDYLFKIKKLYGILVFSCTNVLGINPIFTYQYSNRIIANNNFYKEPITYQAPRFFFIGIFLSLGTDKRQEEIDKLLQ